MGTCFNWDRKIAEALPTKPVRTSRVIRMPLVPAEDGSKKETPHTFAPYNMRSVEYDPPTFTEKDNFLAVDDQPTNSS